MVVRVPAILTRFTVGRCFLLFLPICAGLGLFYLRVGILRGGYFSRFEQTRQLFPVRKEQKPR